MNQHEFAFYTAALPSLKNIRMHEPCCIGDEQLTYRVHKVVRLKQGALLIIFNEAYSIYGALRECTSTHVIVDVQRLQEHVPLMPRIRWFLPLLEREAFETSITHATVMGVTAIQPVITAKSGRRLSAPDRLQRLMIAAAEQSKQFVLPTLMEPLSFDHIRWPSPLIFFDMQGNFAWDVINRLRKDCSPEIWCMVGPEGDLTHNEKEVLRTAGAQFCTLTPTVLRACDAVTVSTGLLRSLL